MYTSLIGQGKNINRHFRSFCSLVQTAPELHNESDAKRKRKTRRFPPCASSEPQKTKDMWLDKLKLPYYSAFDKIRSKAMTPEDQMVDVNSKFPANPVPVGIGLNRQEVMDEKLAKLIKEYVTQREANVKSMKTQILSGREPDEKIPEVVVEENRQEQLMAAEDARPENSDANKKKRAKDTRILRAV